MTDKLPPIGTRVRIRPSTMGPYARIGTIVRHLSNGVVEVELKDGTLALYHVDGLTLLEEP